MKHSLTMGMLCAFIALSMMVTGDPVMAAAEKKDMTTATATATTTAATAAVPATTTATTTQLEGELEVLTSDVGEFFVLHMAEDRIVELKLNTHAQTKLSMVTGSVSPAFRRRAGGPAPPKTPVPMSCPSTSSLITR